MLESRTVPIERQLQHRSFQIKLPIPFHLQSMNLIELYIR